MTKSTGLLVCRNIETISMLKNKLHCIVKTAQTKYNKTRTATKERQRGTIMKIGIGNDHSAVEMKQDIAAYLEEKGYEVVNYGTDSHESCDYPVYGEKVGRAVAAGDVDFGIVICGTGLGISLAANKVRGIRAVVCSEPYTARLARQHNDANVLAFGARVIGIELAKMIVDEFLSAKFEGGRHQRRVDMIMDIEKREAE